MSGKKKKPVTTVVQKDGLDDFVFSVIRDGSKVGELCNEPSSEGLLQDVFTSFFSSSPKISEEAAGVQKDIVSAFHDLPEFDELRASTAADEVASGLGVMQFGPELIDQYRAAKQKLEEKQQEASEKGEQGPQNLGDAMSEGEKAAMRQAHRKAQKKAQEADDDWQDTVSLWGVNPGELQRVPVEKRFELAEKLSNSTRLKKISDLAGRFQNIVHSAAANAPVHGVDEIVDISISSDVSKILPTELVKLIEMPEVFYQDLFEGKLLTYNLRGVQDLGKGPIIACLDISASMSGEREEWSKAVVLSLMALAQKQGRAFGFIAFNAEVTEQKFWGKGQPLSLEDKLSIASVASTGGTNFYAPLKAAFEMRSKEPTLKPADIVFITDGDCNLTEQQSAEILSMKASQGVRIQSIAICEGAYSSLNTDVLSRFSDQLAKVNNFGDIDILDKVLSRAASGAAVEEAKYG